MRKAVFRSATEEGTHMTTPSSNSGTRVRQAQSSPPSTPRWVKVSVIIFIILVLLVLIIELTGHGFGGPMIPASVSSRSAHMSLPRSAGLARSLPSWLLPSPV